MPGIPGFGHDLAFDQADFLGYWPVALLAWRNRYLIGDPKLSGVQGQSANNSRGISMSTGMYQASQSTPDDDVTVRRDEDTSTEEGDLSGAREAPAHRTPSRCP